MSRWKKLAIWMTGVVGALLVLLLILMLLLPRIINLESVKQKIIARISQEVGGELEYQSVDFSFFPRPLVIIHRGSVSIPGKITGTLESLKIYPEILPLLRGRVRITMLQGEAPHFKMGLPKLPEEREGEPRTFSLATIGEEVAPVLGLLVSKAPDLTLVVDGGRFDLTEGNTSVFRFQDIHGRISLPPDKLEIVLVCDSNLWESMSLEAWLNGKDLKGRGRIQVREFKPQVLTDNLFPLAAQRVGESRVNLDVSFKMDGLEVLEGEVLGSFPLLTLRRDKERLVIKAKSLMGAFHMEDDRITISLAELDLDHPQLKMSGKLFIDQAAPRVSLELEGREIDVNSMREAALAAVGDTSSAREILNVVKGGRIPLITVNAQGSSWADLGKVENINIKGSVTGGKAFIPGAKVGLKGVNLDVRNINGEVAVSKGILEGENLGARWKNTQVREGMLRLGLKGKDAPIHMETVIEVDLAQLPAVVGGFLRDDVIQKELALIKEIRGNAVGRLVLGENIQSIKAKLDISECDLFARHGRIPYPLEIENGKFSYDGAKIDVKNLNGKVGKSTFSQVTAKLSFDKVPFLEILSGKSSLYAGEIYSWLSSLEGLGGELKKLKSVQGSIALSELGLKGPLLKREKWRFRVKGQFADLAMESSLFPGTVTVTRAGFMATREKISLADCETGMLDASLRVSGFFNGYLEGPPEGKFDLQGNMGPEAMKWVSNLIDVPPELRIRAPLAISRAHAGWDKGGKTFFSADLAVKDGPRVSIDMHLNPAEFTIKNLLIRDRKSHASIALRLKKRELYLGFKGHLNKATLDKVFMENEILKGRINGNFKAHILMDRPMRSTAKGILQGVGLGYPLELKVPLTIEDVSLKARKNRLNVESALLTWGDSHLNLNGNMDFSGDEFLFDMDLSADGLEWEKIEEILHEENKGTGAERHTDFWATPLEGTLRVKLGHFRYEKLTWKPVHAALSFMAGGIKVAVTEANVCGISTTGTVRVSPKEVRFRINPLSKNEELDSALACLLDKKGFVSGNFDLKGRLTGRGREEELTRSLGGNFEFLARDGRIYHSIPLSRVLGLINTTEILRGKLPDLRKESLAYDSIEVKGNLQGGKLKIKEGIMDGRSMEIAAQGEIDLINQQMDLTMLVAPLKTIDAGVRRIPLIRDILQGTLVSIPVRVSGDLGNPTVRPLSASAVRSELVGVMKRTFRLPIKVIQPLRRGKGKE